MHLIWNEFLVEKGIVTDKGFLEEDKSLMTLYAQGKMDMKSYLEFSMAPLATKTKAQVSELVEECVMRHILPKQFRQSKVLIEQLKQQEVDMVVVSASVTFLVEVVARHLGIQTALGINLAEHHGCYSSEIEGIATYREGKITRLEQWLNKTPKSYSAIHFYTDSINDLPLCEYADHTYLVNPCPLLLTVAEKCDWAILDWDSNPAFHL